MPKNLVICDIDGTLAHHDETMRGHFEYEKCDKDQPIWDVIHLVRLLIDSGYEIIFMSGREDRVKELTIDWLFYNIARAECADPVLYMRSTGDRRKDAVVKRELFEEHLGKRRDDVWFVLEDRDQMVQMWRAEGLTCLQVADGAF